MEVLYFKEENSDEWDQFIFEQSVNGTFLHTRKFLNYHPKERFMDCSLIVKEDNRIVAVCPACVINDSANNTIFYSHMGSTYGGVVFHKKHYCMEKTLIILSEVERFLYKNGYKKIVYKITPDILTLGGSDLNEFTLKFLRYSEELELNNYIDLKDYKEDIVSNFKQGKRTHINKWKQFNTHVDILNNQDQKRELYRLMCETLEKYERKPVHAYEELIDLADNRLRNNIVLYGVYLDNELVGGAVVFLYEKTKCFHTQYLASKNCYEKLSPMTYTYYAMLKEAKKMGYRYVSWGISTEHGGNSINWGLTKSKEDYGSKHSVNRIFTKNISADSWIFNSEKQN